MQQVDRSCETGLVVVETPRLNRSVTCYEFISKTIIINSSSCNFCLSPMDFALHNFYNKHEMWDVTMSSHRPGSAGTLLVSMHNSLACLSALLIHRVVLSDSRPMIVILSQLITWSFVLTMIGDHRSILLWVSMLWVSMIADHRSILLWVWSLITDPFCSEWVWSLITDLFCCEWVWSLITDPFCSEWVCSEWVWSVIPDPFCSEWLWPLITDPFCSEWVCSEWVWSLITDPFCSEWLWSLITDPFCSEWLWSLITDLFSSEWVCSEWLWSLITDPFCSEWVCSEWLWSLITDPFCSDCHCVLVLLLYFQRSCNGCSSNRFVVCNMPVFESVHSWAVTTGVMSTRCLVVTSALCLLSMYTVKLTFDLLHSCSSWQLCTWSQWMKSVVS